MNAQEWLCLWYLRLNGYFTTPNFIVHGRRGPLTEVDVLDARFPYSAEAGFEDDKRLAIPPDVIDIVFAEAKRRQAGLNGPWSSPDAGALDYVLRRVGVVTKDKISEPAKDLYSRRRATLNNFVVRIVCFGQSRDGLDEHATFIDWQHVLGFVHQRFAANKRLKADHQAWDKFGKYLWEKLTCASFPTPDELFGEWDRQP